MRICYTSDLHGSRKHYQQLEEVLRSERPALMILGGDMLPDGRPPNPPGDQAAWAAVELRAYVESYKRVVDRMAVAICMGNHDWRAAEDAVRVLEAQGILVLLEPSRTWLYDGIHFLGCSFTPPTPHFVKDYERLDTDDSELPEFDCEILSWDGRGIRRSTAEEYFLGRPSIKALLDEIPTPPTPWIFVAHAPPFDTLLDRLPNLEHPIGSRAVRDFIEQRRPLCALHGHVHESPEVTHGCIHQLDGVPCINPGQGRERLYAVTFDTADIPGTLRHTEFR